MSARVTRGERLIQASSFAPIVGNPSALTPNASRSTARRRKYHLEHPEKRQEHDRNRRACLRATHRQALEKGSISKITAAEWQEIKDKYKNKCLYPECGRVDITMDHIVPLALGGTHTANNIQPLCRYHNTSKGKKIADYRKMVVQ